MKYRSPVIAGVVAVTLAALVVLFATSPKGRDPADNTNSPLLGSLAPSIRGVGITGERFDLDKLRGTWVVVNFFATWCPPCVAEHPELVRFSRDMQGQAQLVTVAAGDTEANVRRFFEERGGTWPVLAKDTEQVSIDYGVIKLPESYLIDPQGIVVRKFVGGVTAKELEGAITSRRSAATGAAAVGGGG